MACPIGAMVMGFELDEAKSAELMSLVGDMCAINYIDEAEVANIPHFDPPAGGIVYGPLWLTFHWLPTPWSYGRTPRQAMLLEEALGGTHWHGVGGSVLGRPACAPPCRAPLAERYGHAVRRLRRHAYLHRDSGRVHLDGNPRELSLMELVQALETTLAAN